MRPRSIREGAGNAACGSAAGVDAPAVPPCTHQPAASAGQTRHRSDNPKQQRRALALLRTLHSARSGAWQGNDHRRDTDRRGLRHDGGLLRRSGLLR
jgi:hypothetical protein